MYKMTADVTCLNLWVCFSIDENMLGKKLVYN